MCERAVSDELEALNFKTFFAQRQPWWCLTTFEFLFSTAVHTVSYSKNKMSSIRLCMFKLHKRRISKRAQFVKWPQNFINTPPLNEMLVGTALTVAATGLSKQAGGRWSSGGCYEVYRRLLCFGTLIIFKQVKNVNSTTLLCFSLFSPL